MVWIVALHLMANGTMIRDMVTGIAPFQTETQCEQFIKAMPQLSQNPPKGDTIVPTCESKPFGDVFKHNLPNGKVIK